MKNKYLQVIQKKQQKKKTEVVFLIPLSTPFSFKERFGSIPRILSSTHLGTGRHHQAFLVAKTNWGYSFHHDTLQSLKKY